MSKPIEMLISEAVARLCSDFRVDCPKISPQHANSSKAWILDNLIEALKAEKVGPHICDDFIHVAQAAIDLRESRADSRFQDGKEWCSHCGVYH